ncbi:MAG: pstC [Thermoleophilia bacterium]|nr:pstC [Thermoleophilia bacterium]
MTDTATPDRSVVTPGPLDSLKRPRGRLDRGSDRLFRIGTAGFAVVVLVVLGLMIWFTTMRSLPVVQATGASFVTSSDWLPSAGDLGTLSFVYGTLVTAAVAMLLAVPVAIGVALFLSEIAPKRLRTPLAYLIDLLAAVPSVVYGLWGVLVLVPFLGNHVWGPVSDHAGGFPLFEGPATGRSYATAGIVLAIMALPIITAITREVIATVPSAHREAALALGATRWEVIRLAVLPYAKSGITGAVMLGLGRAMGETIAVALVIGGSSTISASLFHPGYTMASVIANEFPEATGDHINALIGIGVLLFVLTLIINVGARLLVWRTARKLR